MSNARRFQQLAGIAAVLGTMIVIGNVITLFASTRNQASNFFNDPGLLLSIGASGANLFHWSMVLDLFGYLAFAPIALFCWFWLKSRNEYMMLFYTVCGLGYSLAGSAGAAILAAIVPKLVSEYALASAAQQESLRSLVDTFYRAVAYGVWNPLEVLFVSVWFLGIGSLLRRERPGLGIFALIISAFAILDPVGWILNNSLIFNIGGIGTALILIWSLWFGIDLLRGPLRIAQPQPVI